YALTSLLPLRGGCRARRGRFRCAYRRTGTCYDLVAVEAEMGANGTGNVLDERDRSLALLLGHCRVQRRELGRIGLLVDGAIDKQSGAQEADRSQPVPRRHHLADVVPRVLGDDAPFPFPLLSPRSVRGSGVRGSLHRGACFLLRFTLRGEPCTQASGCSLDLL